MIGAIATNEHSLRGKIIHVEVTSSGGVTPKQLIVKLPESFDAVFSFEGRGYVFHPWCYKKFSQQECKEFGVDFGAWLSS